MFDDLQAGSVVKTTAGIGRVYRRDPGTVTVMIQYDDGSMAMNMYCCADVEVLHCDYFDKPCDFSKYVTCGYPLCCDQCKFDKQLSDDIDE